VSKFPLGRVVMTQGALAALSQPGTRWTEMLVRHANGDWGELDADDREMNNAAIANGDRILSAYKLFANKPYEDGNQVWIITEADRSATTILLPEEY
jgi:hypothetical protein